MYFINERLLTKLTRIIYLFATDILQSENSFKIFHKAFNYENPTLDVKALPLFSSAKCLLLWRRDHNYVPRFSPLFRR